MGVLDKIKNALFEVEYVEVEEPVKKEKRSKDKVKNVEKNEKPIAKKIVLPGKKEEKVEELEEELNNEDLETRSSNESLKENNREEFKFMDDSDFKMDDEEYTPEEPEIVKVIGKDEDEYYHREKRSSRVEKKSHRDRDYMEKVDRDEIDHPDKLYSNSSYNKNNSLSHDSKPYGLDNTYNVPVHEYGTYDKKEERTYFKPSPIISPIYGILDKNYKKEDVVQKKEIRLTTNYTRSNVSVDDIRNKAYGTMNEEEDKNEFSPRTFELEDDEDDDLLVDLSDDKGKPEVKELTMGDALEYFQDLGLEYNVDYVDASKERTTPRRVKDNYDEVIEEKDLDNSPAYTKRVDEEKSKEVEKEVKTTNVVEIKDESKNEDTHVSLDDDDNLFDLIDSMYQESE